MSQRYDKRYPVCLSPKKLSLRKDRWSVCHLTSEKIHGLSVTSKTLGRCTPSSASRIQIQGLCSPHPPHLFFHAKKGMEGWIKTKFRLKTRIQIRGRCTPRTPALPQPPTSLFRSNRYGVLNEKSNLDSGCCTPIRKDIQQVGGVWKIRKIKIFSFLLVSMMLYAYTIIIRLMVLP